MEQSATPITTTITLIGRLIARRINHTVYVLRFSAAIRAA
jgi:hypothetical protein